MIENEKFFWSHREEYSFSGPCASIDECINEFKNDFEDEDTVYIGVPGRLDTSVCGKNFWENHVENIPDAYEDFYEKACDAPTEEQLNLLGERLNEVIERWIEENGISDIFDCITPHKEIKITR